MKMDSQAQIDMAEWRNLPCVRDRIATRADSESGAAAFFIPRNEEDYPNSDSEATFAEEVRTIPLDIPCCAIHRSEEGDVPVIVIQAESTVHNGKENNLAGYRSLDGGTGICMLEELEILTGPDDRFFSA
jgi:hypothetical protein